MIKQATSVINFQDTRNRLYLGQKDERGVIKSNFSPCYRIVMQHDFWPRYTIIYWMNLKSNFFFDEHTGEQISKQEMWELQEHIRDFWRANLIKDPLKFPAYVPFSFQTIKTQNLDRDDIKNKLK